VIRDKTIIVGMVNGIEYETVSNNEIQWSYIYQDGNATKIRYKSGELNSTFEIPEKLDGYVVTSIRKFCIL
jgi:hypothetical protein